MITYTKDGRSRVLNYKDRGGLAKVARAASEQAAQDALLLFWSDDPLAPWLEWL